MIKEQKYSVKGTHCASCEILIEKKLLEEKNIKAAESSNQKGQVLIEYEGGKPSLKHLNKLFEKEGYTFSDFNETPAKKPASGYEFFMAVASGDWL